MNKDYDMAVQFHRTGMLEKSEKLCLKVLSKKPKHALALHLLGKIAYQENNPAAAIEWFSKAVAAKPDLAIACNDLGAAYLACNQLDEAVKSFQKAVQIQPDYAWALWNLSIILKDCARIDESINACKQAVAAKISWHVARSGLLMTSHYRFAQDPLAHLQEHRLWDRVHAGHLAGTISPYHNNKVMQRPLRIGLVSPDFKKHPVLRFLMPFLEYHDPQQVELFAYGNVTEPDEWTELARRHVEHWRDVTKMSDVEAANLIRSDEIDVLVDLSGHTHGNRLLVFAHKPAPVQVTYLGYPGTTGLSAMDYRITDAFADPPGMTELHHSEQLMRLPDCAWCYGIDSRLPLGQNPAISRGYVTFGSFNNLAKLNEQMLAVWAKILSAVPGSKLLLKAVGLRSMETCKWISNKLNIDIARLDLRGTLESHDAHLDLYGEMDIALDTFPYHGTTTTCEALWMGVPVVTLAGNTHVSRVGVSLLHNAGFPQLVAQSEEEYVRIAVDLAANAANHADQRIQIRDRLLASKLLDGPSFARELESLFQKLLTI